MRCPTILIPLLASSALLGQATSASAQALNAQEAAALRAEVEALRGQVNQLSARLDALTVPPTPVTTPTPAPAPASPSPSAPNNVAWRGAPEMQGADGWSFKPRGRMQIDVGGVNVPAAADNAGLGFASEVRRVQLGADGTMPGGFSYRVEADFADNDVAVLDAYLRYRRGNVQVTAGHQKYFAGLDEMTSDIFTSFTERAAFTQAFGFERRLGLAAEYAQGPILVQAGLFSDDISALTNAANNGWSVDGRIVYAPQMGDTQLHFGLSAHARDFNDGSSVARYRARPFTHVTDVRLVDTGNFTANGERNWGAEFALIQGRFHFAAEGAWMRARRPLVADPGFGGYYIEAGLFLTDDKRNYRRGAFDRVTPSAGVGNGGMGAVELNLRYDMLDLNDAGIIGGRQQSYSAAVTWVLTPYIRLLASYARLSIDDSRLPAGLDWDYGADAAALRAQFDF